MTNTKEAINRFRNILDWVDDLSEFVTETMKVFDELKSSGQRSEIEIGLENWLNPETEEHA